MTYLHCRYRKKAGCPWKCDDESYDALGQLREHERECSDFQGAQYVLERIALAMSVERINHLERRAS